MVNNGQKLFIIGGKDDNTMTNEIWEFNLGVYEYKLITDGGLDAPVRGTNYNCILRDNKIIILNGESFGTTPLIDVHSFDLESGDW